MKTIENLNLEYLSKKETQEINGGWGGIRVPSLAGLLLFLDAVSAIAEGMEEAYQEKCGCTE